MRLAALAAVLALCLAGSAGSVETPRIVVQFGHAGPVDAAGWTPDGRYLVTSAASDGAVIIWDVASGVIVDRLSLPALESNRAFTPLSVHQIVVAPDGKTASITVLAAANRGAGPLAAARYEVRMDLASRSLAIVGAPKVIEGRAPAGALNLDAAARLIPPAVLPNSPDGSLRLDRAGHGLTVARVDGSAPARDLIGAERGLHDDLDVSPDGSRLAGLVRIYGGITTLVQVWDLAGNAALSTLIKAGPYEHVRWIDPTHYVVTGLGRAAPAATGPEDALSGALAPPMPGLVVDSDSLEAPRGGAQATIPSRCMMTAVGATGAFVAAGPAMCGAKASAEDGLFFYPPPHAGAGADVGWRRLDVAELAGRSVTAIAAAPNGRDVVLATRAAEAGQAAAPSLLLVDMDRRAARVLDAGGILEHAAAIDRLFFSTDGGLLLFDAPAGVVALDLAGGAPRVFKTGVYQPRLIASDGHSLIVGGEGVQRLERFDVATQQLLPMTETQGVVAGGFLSGKPIFWTGSDDGVLRFWQSRGGALLVTVFSFPNNGFFAATPEGRYDTNMGPDTDALRWLLPAAPFSPLPAQTFMRDYYQPGLVARVLDCAAADDCASVLKPLRPIAGLDLALPVVTIDRVDPGRSPHTARIAVTASEGEPPTGAAGMASGVFDLRLFRDGKLVAQAPPPKEEPAPSGAAESLASWRSTSSLLTPGRGGAVRRVFDVQVPSDGDAVEFTAYAFTPTA